MALLKLHCCITCTHDLQIPLILTMDQYATYRVGRNRVFKMLEEWGSENTIIFVGHKIQDHNLRGILIDLSQKIPSRPTYYLVRPNITHEERNFWANKQISVLDGTFEDLLNKLDSAISKDFRPLAAKLETDHPVRMHFTVQNKPSSALIEFLTNDFEYVHADMPVTIGDPSQFYAGFGLDWYPVKAKLDVRRRLTDKLLEDIILRPEEDRPSKVELYAVKAEAGAGKSVLIRRVAWEAAIHAGVVCLRSRETCPQNFEALKELSNATKERIFLFIDNAGDCLGQIRNFLEFARSKKLRLTIITAERANEWNISCGDLEKHLSDKYSLHYLNHSEIETLVRLLTKHQSLGPNLINKTFEEQIGEFEKRAGRQLLVAFHEATKGFLFEEILLDEYKKIVPPEAQRLYLTVCVLNRLKVLVRAGLMSRVHGIPFDDFRKHLFEPLEHVVHASELPWGDYAYRARHSEIAQIVFEQVLTDPTELFNEYIRILRALNLMFTVDSEALRSMLRARSIHDLFPRYEDAKAIFDAAEEIIGDEAYFFQQKANYERIRPDGNLKYAQNLLEEARKIEPSDSTIVHTLSEVLRSRAEVSNKKLERARLRSEALSILDSIQSTAHTAQYAAVTRLKLVTDAVRDVISDDSSYERSIDETIRSAERAFENARQRYPGDKFVLSTESEFAKLINEHDRSFEALKKARDSNPRDPYLASRLADIFVRRDNLPKAQECILTALESNRGDKRLNFQYAELLRGQSDTKSDQLAYYYRRAFTKWDDNYESQFWYARFLFESRDATKVREAKEVFKVLREIPISYEERINVRDAIGGLSNPKIFSGIITRFEATHGFITVDGRGDWVFFHETDASIDCRISLASGTRVVFAIGFSLRGPKALKLRIEGGTA